MTTKTITLKNNGLTWPSEPFYFRLLESMVQTVKTSIESEEEEKTCVLDPKTGLFSYQHTLTPIEEATQLKDDAEASLREINGLLPRDGEALPPELLKRIRILAGGGGGGPAEPL